MNKFEQFNVVETAEPSIAELKAKVHEYLFADVEQEERTVRRGNLENKKAMLAEHFPNCRKYKTFYLLSTSGETAPESADKFDFDPPHSVVEFINSLQV